MRTNENCLKSSGRNWTKERSNEHHSKARSRRNQAHGEEAPRVLSGRHGNRQRRRRRRRAQARPGLRGRGDRQEEPRHQFLVHRAQGVLGRGRRAHLPDLFPADRLDRAQAQGRRAPRQALLHAQALGQGGAHPRENRRSRAGRRAGRRAVSSVCPLLDEEGCPEGAGWWRACQTTPALRATPPYPRRGRPTYFSERRKILARKRATPMSLNSIQEIIAELKAGRMAALVDDEDRENEGDLIFAAEFVTAEKINFMAKFGRGLVCMPITEAHAERLNLLPMV